jgi:hypothetical protein
VSAALSGRQLTVADLRPRESVAAVQLLPKPAVPPLPPRPRPPTPPPAAAPKSKPPKPPLSPEQAAQRAAHAEHERQLHLEAVARKRAACEAVLARLQTLYPDVFNPVMPKPLAIGVHVAIIAALPEFTPRQVGRALGWWTWSRQGYLAQMRTASCRYSLNGEPASGEAGTITDAQREAAREQLDRLRKKRKAAA